MSAEVKLPLAQDDLDGFGQGEIAGLLGVTKQAVGDVERRAIRKIWRMQVAHVTPAWGLRGPLPRKP